MIKHTLANLGPAVSANRMVAEYVQRLYQPAAESGRRASADNYASVRELAHWIGQLRRAWPAVRIGHVESHGLPDDPQIGETVEVRAWVELGQLNPGDVQVNVVYGTAGSSDELRDTHTLALDHLQDDGSGRHHFGADLLIDRSGDFGYGVEILPRHEALAGPAELGLITTAR